MKPNSDSKTAREYRRAFESVMATYAIEKDKCFHRPGGVKQKRWTPESGVIAVKPSPADLCADVELSATRSLNAPQLALFTLIYVDERRVPASVQKDETFRRVHDLIKLKVGRAFIARRIDPIGEYWRGWRKYDAKCRTCERGTIARAAGVGR